MVEIISLSTQICLAPLVLACLLTLMETTLPYFLMLAVLNFQNLFEFQKFSEDFTFIGGLAPTRPPLSLPLSNCCILALMWLVVSRTFF
jgi:hypothetical protein